MELTLKRIALRSEYTIGKLYVDGEYVCDTIEDTVRDLDKDGKFTNGEVKIPGKTAIPYGRYEITMDVVSPKFSKYPFYQNCCNGKLPRLLNVPHFSGILIHCAEGYKGAELVQGCIGIGFNTIVGGLTSSKEAFLEINNILQEAKKRDEKIYIAIV